MCALKRNYAEILRPRVNSQPINCKPIFAKTNSSATKQESASLDAVEGDRKGICHGFAKILKCRTTSFA